MQAAAAGDPFLDVEFLSRPGGRLIEEIVAYWESKRAGRLAPRRADIDPTEIPRLLPYLFMLDVLDGGADFRYRLIGTHITEGMGRDVTGKKISELYEDRPQARKQLDATFRLPLTNKQPIFSRGRVFWMPRREYQRFIGCSLPLSSDGATIDIVLAALVITLGGAAKP